MGDVRVGVVGVGSWGLNHVRVFSELTGVKLTAITDINPKRAVEVAEKFHVNWYTNLEEMLRKEDLDAVTIATPTSTHAKVAVKVIEEGKHVLVEKPIAKTVEEAVEIVKKAEKAGVILMVGHIERFNPAVKKARELLEEGEVGQVIAASARRLGMMWTLITDVGVIKDLAIHDIDVLCYLFNGLPNEVFCIAGNLKHSYEDYAYILLRFNEGKTGFIETNWLTPSKVRVLTITGEDGLLHVDYLSQSIVIEKASKRGIQFTHPILLKQEPLKEELKHFVECVKTGEKPDVTGVDGLNALAIAEAAIKSAESRKPIPVKKFNWRA